MTGVDLSQTKGVQQSVSSNMGGGVNQAQDLSKIVRSVRADIQHIKT